MSASQPNRLQTGRLAADRDQAVCARRCRCGTDHRRRPHPAGVSLFLVDSGADGFIATNLPTLDLTRRLASLEFADTPATLLGARAPGRGV